MAGITTGSRGIGPDVRNAYYLRLDRGESVADVAIATGLSEDTVSDFERGVSRWPRTSTVKALADHFGVTARVLLGVHHEAAA